MITLVSMKFDINRQNLRFQGFLNTSHLWEDAHVLDLEQLSLEKVNIAFNTVFDVPLRLGKLVERFLVHQLQHIPNYTILSENYQVQNGTQTIGELDCLLLEDAQPIHLEIVYKFYLYDASVGTTQFEHWIGPNRRDSLHKKLTKLKQKQLPLLYNPLTQTYLKTLGYNATDFKQFVCFKAQLFLPYGDQTINIETLNKNCIQGFYINHTQLLEFKTCKFFIPKKLDWLMDIPIHIDWLSFDHFNIKIQTFLKEQSAPLCWIKYPNGVTTKCFVIWW